MTNYKKILVSVAASAVVASAVYAASPSHLEQGNAVNPNTKASAYFNNADYNITSTDGINYIPGANIASGSKLVLQVTNGSIAGDLLYFKHNGDTETLFNIDTTQSTRNAADTGYSTLVLIAQKDITQDTDMNLTTDNSSINIPTIIGNKGLQADQNVTIKITTVEYGQGVNSAAIPDETLNIIGVTKSFEMDAIEASKAVIDVEKQRKEFTNGTDDNGSISLSKKIKLNDNTQGLADNAILTVKADGSCDSVTKVGYLPDGAATAYTGFTYSDSNDSAHCTWTMKGNTLFDTIKDANGIKVAIETNASKVHAPVKWTATLDVNGSDIGTVNMFTDEKIIDWTMNGMQFVVPYLSTDQGYGTYLLVTNTTNKTVGVKADIYADKGQDGGTAQTNMICSNVALSPLPANSTKLYLPAEINDAVETKCAGFKAGNARYMGKFTAETAAGNVIPTAFQRDAATGGKRSVPVYKSTETAKWAE